MPNHEEPIDGVLQRFLRRKFIQHGNPLLQKEAFRIADWLALAWKHVNVVIEKFHSANYTIGKAIIHVFSMIKTHRFLISPIFKGTFMASTMYQTFIKVKHFENDIAANQSRKLSSKLYFHVHFNGCRRIILSRL